MRFVPNFRIDARDSESSITLELAGELDSATCPELVSGFEETIAALGGRELVVDLAEVTFIDSSGMRAIISIERRAAEAGVALALLPPPADVTELLEITGITDRVGLKPRADESSRVESFVERVDIALPRASDSPARARAELRQAAGGRLPDPNVATATLLTSELVTNAVIHPVPAISGSIGLRITVFADRVRVEVTDQGSGFDATNLPPARLGEPGGHGLFVVDGLSSRWGTGRRAVGDGKEFLVWFELDAGPDRDAGRARDAAERAGQFSTPSRSQQYSSRHSLASSMHRASESHGSTVSNA